MTAAPHRPLAGVKVVEVASFLSAPFAGLILADLGADVVKVEPPPKGDPFRGFGRPTGPFSGVFANVNAGKRSVALDLKNPDGAAALRTLLRHADVFLSNWRPGVADRLGLADADLAADNPRLVRIYVSGYGPTGPDAEKPAFDSVIQARSAYSWAEGTADGPRLAGGYPVDKVTALFVAQAAMAALLDRHRTGAGTSIDVAMLDVVAFLNFPEHFANRTFVDEQPEDARNFAATAIRPIATSDGWIVVAPVSSAQVRRAVEAMGHPEWGDELLADRDATRLTRNLIDRLESSTRTHTTAECLSRFDAFDVPVGACTTGDGLLADAQVAHNQLFEVRDRPGLGRVRQVRYPARSADWGLLHPLGPAPHLDADRASVLGDS